MRIGISGSYGGLNLGDEAILHSIIRQLRDSIDAQLVVFTRNPEDTYRRHGVDRAVSRLDLTREEARAEVEQLDLLILGGGGILFDRDAESYLREVALAHEAKVPVMVYAISAGPLEDPAVRRSVARQLNRAAAITVRDRQAKKLLEEAGVTSEITLTADPAFLLEPEPLPEDALTAEGLTDRDDEGKRLVAFSVREPGPAAPDMDVDHYHGLLANTADFMVDRLNADVVFVPMERNKMDVQHSHAVVAKMHCAQRATVLKGEYTPGQLLTLLGEFHFAIGMRLHFLIFSALQNVPFVALPYASKVEGLVQDLDMPMPPLKEVTAGRLIAHVDRSWDMHERLRERIRARIVELKHRASQTHDILMDVIKASTHARS